MYPERFTAQALLQDLENTDTSFQTRVAGVPVTEDLDWVGPRDATFPPKREEDPTAIVSQRSQPEVSPMDIDKEQPDVALSTKPGETATDEAKSGGSLRKDGHSVKAVGGTKLFSVENITAVMNRAVENPLPAMRILNAMTASSDAVTGGDGREGAVGILTELGLDWRREEAMMKALVPKLLDSSCPRCLQDQFCSWWRALPSSTHECLAPVLWDLVRDPSMPNCGESGGLNVGHQAAQFKQSAVRRAGGGPVRVTLLSSGFPEEPLKFLACDAKVFRSPLLGVVLDILLELLVANQRICELAARDGGRDAGIKKDEVAAALVAQDRYVPLLLRSTFSYHISFSPCSG